MVNRTLTPARLVLNQVYEIRELLNIHESITTFNVQLPEFTEIIFEKIAGINENVTEADFAAEKIQLLGMLTDIVMLLRDLDVSRYPERNDQRKRRTRLEKVNHSTRTSAIRSDHFAGDVHASG